MYLYIDEDGSLRQSPNAPDSDDLSYHAATGTPIVKFENNTFFESEITAEEVEVEGAEEGESDFELQYSVEWQRIKDR